MEQLNNKPNLSNTENQKQSFSNIPPQNSNRHLKIIIGILSILLVIVSGIASMYMLKGKNIAEDKSKDSAISNEVPPAKLPIEKPETEPAPVIIYTEEIDFTETRTRGWPTVRVMRKIGDAEPETLTEVGKVGEMPYSFQLSPDKNYLLVNLESKLQLLNLETLELKDIFSANDQVLGTSFSPDGEQLFIWDQIYVSRVDGSDDYSAHIYNLVDHGEQIIKIGSSSSRFKPSVWRSDNKVILEAMEGEYSIVWYFDLSNKQLSKVPGDIMAGLTSQSGERMTTLTEWIDDICSDKSGFSPSVYNIIDPVSGDSMGTIGGQGNIVTVLAFSPDDNEVLYAAKKPLTDRDDCFKYDDVEETYYKVHIPSEEIEEVENKKDVMKSWDPNYVGAKVERGLVQSSWSILIDNEVVVSSDNRLKLVGQFYSQ